ncbi:uncharacterized protein PADG_12399 [Paracoccidioides brasiliensis Pb18]|uniref:Uncharacterized protein n=1 Tax=Paracoccidioides brasiliensis (strain Pb18) TaxID=502780 RepID=A0A0A0HU49_PARBD|nr:uncharacterized protein PADG_12399 [Paracoccidioides brasiliensis Pb18]KGM91541.1 hypothetical protein PADG_12399 [Paracoccidioides brasiliensis Pb18]
MSDSARLDWLVEFKIIRLLETQSGVLKIMAWLFSQFVLAVKQKHNEGLEVPLSVPTVLTTGRLHPADSAKYCPEWRHGRRGS